jgi:uncharacterized repeat protein (TIGR01451 family)
VIPGKVAATRSRVYTAAIGDSVRADSIPADGSRFALVRIELRDAAGNLLDGRGSDVTVSIDGGATLSAVLETTKPGIYELEVRSVRVNTAKLTVSLDGVTLQDQPVIVFVQAIAALDIQLSASTETPQVGQTIVFTIEVKNLGPNAATGVEVEHQLSDRVQVVSSDATRGRYDAAKGIWTVGGLALGESAVLKVTVTVTK